MVDLRIQLVVDLFELAVVLTVGFGPALLDIARMTRLSWRAASWEAAFSSQCCFRAMCVTRFFTASMSFMALRISLSWASRCSSVATMLSSRAARVCSSKRQRAVLRTARADFQETRLVGQGIQRVEHEGHVVEVVDDVLSGELAASRISNGSSLTASTSATSTTLSGAPVELSCGRLVMWAAST